MVPNVKQCVISVRLLRFEKSIEPTITRHRFP